MNQLIITWILATVAAFSTETVGWRVPVELVVEGGLRHPEVTRLKRPPGESAFFDSGDELWDLSKAVKAEIAASPVTPPPADDVDPFAPVAETEPPFELEEIPFEGDFAVWNARSRMIVARGTFAQLAVVEDAIQLEQQPFSVKTTVTLEAEESTRRLTIASRSGERASALGDPELNAHISLWAAPGRDLIDLNLSAHAEDRSLYTSATLHDGIPLRIARWKEHGRNHGISVESRIVMCWEVPYGEVQWLEANGSIQPRPRADALQLDGRRINDDLTVRVFPVPPDFLTRIGEERTFRRLTPPSRLQKWLASGYIDARPALIMNGVSFDEPDATAGYSPLRNLLVVVNRDLELDLVEQIACWHGCNELPVVELKVETPDGELVLITRTGERTSLTRRAGDEQTDWLVVAPDVDSTGTRVDLWYGLHAPDGAYELDSAITLRSGYPLVVAEADGRIAITATVLDAGR